MTPRSLPLTHDRVQGVPVLPRKVGERAGGSTERRNPRGRIDYRHRPDRDLDRHAIRNPRMGLQFDRLPVNDTVYDFCYGKLLSSILEIPARLNLLAIRPG